MAIEYPSGLEVKIVDGDWGLGTRWYGGVMVRYADRWRVQVGLRWPIGFAWYCSTTYPGQVIDLYADAGLVKVGIFVGTAEEAEWDATWDKDEGATG